MTIIYELRPRLLQTTHKHLLHRKLNYKIFQDANNNIYYINSKKI